LLPKQTRGGEPSLPLPTLPPTCWGTNCQPSQGAIILKLPSSYPLSLPIHTISSFRNFVKHPALVNSSIISICFRLFLQGVFDLVTEYITDPTFVLEDSLVRRGLSIVLSPRAPFQARETTTYAVLEITSNRLLLTFLLSDFDDFSIRIFAPFSSAGYLRSWMCQIVSTFPTTVTVALALRSVPFRYGVQFTCVCFYVVNSLPNSLVCSI
jgi:hypothetical protein